MNDNVTSERIKAIFTAIIIIVVNMAALFGVNLGSEDANTLANGALILADIVAVGYGIWKNHNFTEEAAIAQGYLDELKSAKHLK